MTTMKVMFFSALCTIAVLAATNQSSADEEKPVMRWNNSYQLQSPDGAYSMQFGGRIMWDNTFFFQDDDLEELFGEQKNGTQFRRVRFYNRGSIYNNIQYQLQLDFAGGSVGFRDVHITIRDLPGGGYLRVGQFKEPLRLESLTSSNHMSFMERAFPAGMVRDRNTGLMLSYNLANNRMLWQGGVFRDADGAGNDIQANDGFAVTSRLLGQPYVNSEERRVVHLGAGFSHREPESREFGISQRPETGMGPRYVNTGTIEDVSQIQIFNVEAALVMGPVSVQGEYLQSNTTTSGNNGETYAFNSYYGYVSYFLTGESRNYSNGSFGRVSPNNNFGDGEGGAGAWEVLLRYSGVDLNSGDPDNNGIAGGKLSDITLGLNWYLNPATRAMFNFVHAQLEDEGSANIAQMRLQVAF